MTSRKLNLRDQPFVGEHGSNAVLSSSPYVCFCAADWLLASAIWRHGCCVKRFIPFNFNTDSCVANILIHRRYLTDVLCLLCLTPFWPSSKVLLSLGIYCSTGYYNITMTMWTGQRNENPHLTLNQPSWTPHMPCCLLDQVLIQA